MLFSSGEQKGRSFEVFVNSFWSPLTSIVQEKKYCGSQWGPETVWLSTFFFKKSSFEFSRTTNKCIQV